MFRKTVAMLILIFASALHLQASDSLRLKAIPHPLSWNAQPGDLNIRSANSFTMKAAKGTDLYCFVDGSFYVHQVPMLLFRPEFLHRRITANCPQKRFRSLTGRIIVLSTL